MTVINRGYVILVINCKAADVIRSDRNTALHADREGVTAVLHKQRWGIHLVVLAAEADPQCAELQIRDSYCPGRILGVIPEIVKICHASALAAERNRHEHLRGRVPVARVKEKGARAIVAAFVADPGGRFNLPVADNHGFAVHIAIPVEAFHADCHHFAKPDVDSSGCLVELIGQIARVRRVAWTKRDIQREPGSQNIVALRNRHLRPVVVAGFQNAVVRIKQSATVFGVILLCVRRVCALHTERVGVSEAPCVRVGERFHLYLAADQQIAPVIDSLCIHGRLFAVDQCIRSDIKGCDDPCGVEVDYPH